MRKTMQVPRRPTRNSKPTTTTRGGGGVTTTTRKGRGRRANVEKEGSGVTGKGTKALLY